MTKERERKREREREREREIQIKLLTLLKVWNTEFHNRVEGEENQKKEMC